MRPSGEAPPPRSLGDQARTLESAVGRFNLGNRGQGSFGMGKRYAA
jgi:hypothetical protein